MKVSFNWLKDYVAPGISVEKLLDKLTMAGLEVEKTYSCEGDTVFEMEITPNRADCLSVIGVAREVSAICGKPLKVAKLPTIKMIKQECDIAIVDAQDCSQYNGTVIEGVEVKESPAWLKKKIEAIGLRPVNNIVDITNFCLMELGQPLHAFDYDKLEGKKVVVRRAKKGEKVETIDGESHILDESVMVIADDKRPVAIAGIMGGKDTEVSPKTKNILLESAGFDQVLIRRTSRKLALSSDSSYRFERGIDRALVERGADRAIALILELAKGKVVARSNFLKNKGREKFPKIKLSYKTINSRLGSDLTQNRIKTILKSLGFSVESGKVFMVLTPPSFRPDVKEEVDVIEEVARIVGYDSLPLSLPAIKADNVAENVKRLNRKAIRDYIISSGYSETVTFSMINSALLKKSGLEEASMLRIKNPLSLDQEIMRPSMLPSMLNVLLTNTNRRLKDVRIFEFGKVYKQGKERECLSFLATGRSIDDWRKDSTTNIEFYDLKGVVEGLLLKTGRHIKKYIFRRSNEQYLNGQQANIIAKDKMLGVIGEVRAEILQQWHIKAKNVFYGEIDMERFLDFIGTTKTFKPLVEYPSVVRDISLAVKKKTCFQDVLNAIEAVSAKNLKGVKFVEEYLGDKIDQGCRGLIVSLTYQSSQKTLTEEEVNEEHNKVCRALEKELQAVHR